MSSPDAAAERAAGRAGRAKSNPPSNTFHSLAPKSSGRHRQPAQQIKVRLSTTSLSPPTKTSSCISQQGEFTTCKQL